MNRTALGLSLFIVLGLSIAQAADIRRITLEGKEGAPRRPWNRQGRHRPHSQGQRPGAGAVPGQAAAGPGHRPDLPRRRLQHPRHQPRRLLRREAAERVRLRRGDPALSCQRRPADTGTGLRRRASRAGPVAGERRRVRAEHPEDRRDGLLGGRPPHRAADAHRPRPTRRSTSPC